MSNTYISTIVGILAILLPKFGMTVGSEELTATLQTIVIIATGLWTLYERYKKGDVTKLGFRK